MEQYDHGGDIYGLNPPVLDFSISLNPFGPPRKVLEAARSARSKEEIRSLVRDVAEL